MGREPRPGTADLSHGDTPAEDDGHASARLVEPVSQETLTKGGSRPGPKTASGFARPGDLRLLEP